MCLRHKDIQGLDKEKQTMDAFHAKPLHRSKNGKSIPARFDTVIIDDHNTALEDRIGLNSM